MRSIDIAAFDYIDRLKSLTDPAQVRAAFEATLTEIGITNFALVEYSQVSSKFERGIIEDRMPGEWKRHYFEHKYVERDPIIAEVLNNREPFLWSDVHAKCKDIKKQRVIFEEAAEFKLKEGMTVPIFGPQGYAALMTLAGERIDSDPKTRVLIHMMALYTHNHLVQIVRTPPTSQGAEKPLTRRELEALRWAADGKSDWEIGEILKISETVAHEYIENCKRKLGVSTRVQAIVGALVQGHMQI